MALYFLSYDMIKDRDYARILNELKRFDAVRVLYSTWCFNRVNTTTAGLRDHFSKFVDNDDRILVDECKDWATRNAMGTPNELR